jgi:hypothetical protein
MQERVAAHEVAARERLLPKCPKISKKEKTYFICFALNNLSRRRR